MSAEEEEAGPRGLRQGEILSWVLDTSLFFGEDVQPPPRP